MRTFQIGAEFSRPGNDPNLVLMGKTSKGKYLLRRILPEVRETQLLEVFPREVLVPGAVLKLSPSRRRILLERIDRPRVSKWKWFDPDNDIEMSHSELEDLAAEYHAEHQAKKVFSHGNPGNNSAATFFLPKDKDNLKG